MLIIPQQRKRVGPAHHFLQFMGWCRFIMSPFTSKTLYIVMWYVWNTLGQRIYWHTVRQVDWSRFPVTVLLSFHYTTLRSTAWKNPPHAFLRRGSERICPISQALRHVKEPTTSVNYECASKIPCIVPPFASRGLWCICGAWRLWRWLMGTHWGKGTIGLQAAVPKRFHTRLLRAELFYRPTRF